MVKASGLVVVIAASLSCITGRATPPSKPIVEFPAQVRLAAFEGQSVTLPSLGAGGVLPPEGWTVDATSVAVVPAPWLPQSAWDQAFAATYAASGRKAAVTRAMGCVAGEVGRYYLAHETQPSVVMQQFVAGACGVFAPRFGFSWWGGKVPARFANDDLFAEWKRHIEPHLVAQIPPDAKHVGFWYGRQHGRAVAMVTYESAPVELQPVALVPDANGDITIEGRLETDAAYIAGNANQGRFGVKPCLGDPGVPRPRFRITCRMAPEDATAWFQVVYAQPRSVLAAPIVNVLARRDVQAQLTYVDRPYGPARPIADAAAFAPAVIAALNGTRQEAGMRPVRLADAQSAAAVRVARQYFAAELGAGPSGILAPAAVDTINTIALGLLAGWQVAGTIRDGTFVSVVLPQARDAGRWLDAALAMPLGRRALLARDLDEIALGPVLFDRPDAIGSLACGYRFHHGDDHGTDANLLHERVARARESLKLTPPTRLLGMEKVMSRYLTRLDKQDSGWTPIGVLKASLSEGVHKFGASLRGYVIEATALDAFEIPPEIIKHPALKLEIAVSHYKPPGAAWAQMVIVVVYQTGSAVEI